MNDDTNDVMKKAEDERNDDQHIEVNEMEDDGDDASLKKDDLSPEEMIEMKDDDVDENMKENEGDKMNERLEDEAQMMCQEVHKKDDTEGAQSGEKLHEGLLGNDDNARDDQTKMMPEDDEALRGEKCDEGLSGNDHDDAKDDKTEMKPEEEVTVMDDDCNDGQENEAASLIKMMKR